MNNSDYILFFRQRRSTPDSFSHETSSTDKANIHQNNIMNEDERRATRIPIQKAPSTEQFPNTGSPSQESPASAENAEKTPEIIDPPQDTRTEQEPPSAAQQAADLIAYQEAMTIRRMLYQEFLQSRQALQEAEQQRQQLKSQVKDLRDRLMDVFQGPALTRLTQLAQRMRTSPSPEVQAFADELQSALAALGVIPFEPQPGDAFDPKLHEKLNAQDTGRQVAYCCSAGWYDGEDNVLLRAVVQVQ